MEVFSNWRRTLLESESTVKALAKANQGQELTEEDRIGVQTLADEFFFAAAVSYTYGRHSGSMHEETAEIQYTMTNLESNPGLVGEWKRFRPAIDWLSPEFGEAVDIKLKGLNKTE